jgi:hypothetical protein
MPIESFFLSVLFSSGYIALAMPSGWQFRPSSFGFLDTFGLFDSSRWAEKQSAHFEIFAPQFRLTRTDGRIVVTAIISCLLVIRR